MLCASFWRPQMSRVESFNAGVRAVFDEELAAFRAWID